jgi:hypothetical protein
MVFVHTAVLITEACFHDDSILRVKPQPVRPSAINLGSAICHYFFGKKRGFIKLWKTKKFKTFNYQRGHQHSLSCTSKSAGHLNSENEFIDSRSLETD